MGLKLSSREQKRTLHVREKLLTKRWQREGLYDWDVPTMPAMPVPEREKTRQDPGLEDCICGGDRKKLNIHQLAGSRWVKCDNCKRQSRVQDRNEVTDKIIEDWNDMMEEIKTEQLANRAW